MTQNSINNTASVFTVDNLKLDVQTMSSTDTDGDVVLTPDGDGTVSVTAAPIVPTGDRADSLGSATNSWDNVYADGLTFDDGTNVLSAFVDTTSWTPAFTFSGGDTGVTYSTQSGTYVRIEDLVFIQMRVTLTSKGSDTGTASITGLPLTVGPLQYVVPMWTNVTLATNATTVVIQFVNAQTKINLKQVGDSIGLSNVNDTHIENSTQIAFNGFYSIT